MSFVVGIMDVCSWVWWLFCGFEKWKRRILLSCNKTYSGRATEKRDTHFSHLSLDALGLECPNCGFRAVSGLEVYESVSWNSHIQNRRRTLILARDRPRTGWAEFRKRAGEGKKRVRTPGIGVKWHYSGLVSSSEWVIRKRSLGHSRFNRITEINK